MCWFPDPGKTALAVHWAHQVAGRFPDGQLYVDLAGFDPHRSATDPADAIRDFLGALGGPGGGYRKRLAGRRILVLLDNARDTDQVRPMLPGTPGCLAIVTSRNQLTDLVVNEGAHPVPLDLLPTDQAEEMLANGIGADRIAAEPAATGEIITRCARLPLALAMVAARAAVHPRFPLESLAAELRDTSFDGLRPVFSCSYQQLSAHAAWLFRLLGLHPGPEFTAPAAAILAGISLDRTRPLLRELTSASLITEQVPGRFTCHDLLRAYAAEIARTCDADRVREAAMHRIREHYVLQGDSNA